MLVGSSKIDRLFCWCTCQRRRVGGIFRSFFLFLDLVHLPFSFFLSFSSFIHLSFLSSFLFSSSSSSFSSHLLSSCCYVGHSSCLSFFLLVFFFLRRRGEEEEKRPLFFSFLRFWSLDVFLFFFLFFSQLSFSRVFFSFVKQFSVSLLSSPVLQKGATTLSLYPFSSLLCLANLLPFLLLLLFLLLMPTFSFFLVFLSLRQGKVEPFTSHFLAAQALSQVRWQLATSQLASQLPTTTPGPPSSLSPWCCSLSSS